MLISQRTSEELLLIEGKEKLAADVLKEVSRPFGEVEADHAPAKPKKEGVKLKKQNAGKHAGEENPVRGVHFSSFIVQ
jgi:flagellar FliL protein